MDTVHGRTFQITARGQKWSGIWRLDGKEVCVDSSYGSARTAKGRRQPERVAEEALTDLITAWASTSSRARQSASGRPR